MQLARYIQRSFWCPTATDALRYKAMAKSCTPCPNREWQGFSQNCDQMIAALILRLLAFCRPSAICLKIAMIVISSIKTMLYGRSLAHICIKRFKTLFPFRANLYSASTISLKRWMFWIVATLQHRAPRLIFWRFRHTMRCFPVGSMLSQFAHNIELPTTATFCSAAPDTHAARRNPVATFTKCNPVRSSASNAIKTYYEKTPECFTGYIFNHVRQNNTFIANVNPCNDEQTEAGLVVDFAVKYRVRRDNPYSQG